MKPFLVVRRYDYTSGKITCQEYLRWTDAPESYPHWFTNGPAFDDRRKADRREVSR